MTAWSRLLKVHLTALVPGKYSIQKLDCIGLIVTKHRSQKKFVSTSKITWAEIAKARAVTDDYSN